MREFSTLWQVHNPQPFKRKLILSDLPLKVRLLLITNCHSMSDQRRIWLLCKAALRSQTIFFPLFVYSKPLGCTFFKMFADKAPQKAESFWIEENRFSFKRFYLQISVSSRTTYRMKQVASFPGLHSGTLSFKNKARGGLEK